ncbi:hypothetical protein CEXT_223081 [Caerostris extrusa]|uniref:Uncharacterized protein n=1 Tax=Caerostris extrusa TaxID=172846 RepID=A0AAV4RQ71_CAEEX|nr:hypothetical protein CEXT_223081 [Caerostris extrusa]
MVTGVEEARKKMVVFSNVKEVTVPTKGSRQIKRHQSDLLRVACSKFTSGVIHISPSPQDEIDSVLTDDKESAVFKLYSSRNTSSVISLLFECIGRSHQEHLPGARGNFERPGVFHNALITRRHGYRVRRRKKKMSSFLMSKEVTVPTKRSGQIKSVTRLTYYGRVVLSIVPYSV